MLVYPDNRISFDAKINELSHHEETWKEFKYMLLSEKSQSSNAPCSMMSTMYHSSKGKIASSTQISDSRGKQQEFHKGES